MKKQDGYELNVNFKAQKVAFRFTSKGSKGSIKKIIEFAYMQDHYWNLGFGDVKGNDWDDDVISNNNDLRKVLQTVANAIHLFFDLYPDQNVLILPLDNRRTLLYNRIFQQKWKEIEPIFTVKAGALSDPLSKFENYNSTKLYNIFSICPKK
jgi:hypothetical protein